MLGRGGQRSEGIRSRMRGLGDRGRQGEERMGVGRDGIGIGGKLKGQEAGEEAREKGMVTEGKG